MKIKASTILSIISFVGVAVTAVLAAKGGKEAQKIEDEMEQHALDYVDKKDIRKATWKCYIPAIVSGVVTIGCGAYAKRLDTKEIVKLTGAVGLLTTRLEKLGTSFNDYRHIVADEIGVDKEAELAQKLQEEREKNVRNDKTYDFHIDWLGPGKDIYFNRSMADVKDALTNINLRMVDHYDPHWGCPTMSDFLRDLSLYEFITDETDRLCWDAGVLEEEEVPWVFNDIRGYDEKYPCYYDIWLSYLPKGSAYTDNYNMEHRGIL